MGREWDSDYDDVRNKLNKLESVVSEVNKVGCETEELYFARLRLGISSEMQTISEKTPSHAPPDAPTG